MKRSFLLAAAGSVIRDNDPFAELSPEEIAFAELLSQGHDVVRAALESNLLGNATPKGEATVRRHAMMRLASRRKLRDALMAMVAARGAALAARALQEVERICVDARSDRVRLEAAKIILEMAMAREASQPVDQQGQTAPGGFVLAIGGTASQQHAAPERVALFHESAGDVTNKGVE